MEKDIPILKRRQGEAEEAVSRQDVNLLPRRRRQIFLMSPVDGLSAGEIARRLGLSVRTVEKHLELAVRQLQAKEQPAPEVPPAPVPAPRRGLIALAFSLCAALAVGLGISLSVQFGKKPVPEPEWTRVVTAAGETRTVTLADGSTIRLNGGSELFYPSSFTGKERKVFAGGEVYADIARDENRLFRLEAGDIDIQVHGTRFNVRAYPGSDISEIFLDEGSVTAAFGEGASEVRMKPGELVRRINSSGTIERYTCESGQYAAWTEGDNLIFINERLSDIVVDLERRFGTRILIRRDDLKNIRYYASFINHESLRQILSGLNGDGRLHFREDNGNIIIY